MGGKPAKPKSSEIAMSNRNPAPVPNQPPARPPPVSTPVRQFIPEKQQVTPVRLVSPVSPKIIKTEQPPIETSPNKGIAPTSGNQIVSPSRKYVMELSTRIIMLNYSLKQQLKIGDTSRFPDNYEGLKLWETNVLLARYILLNPQTVNGKRILDLAGGVGLVGLTAAKYLNPNSVAICDLQPEYVDNIEKNAAKNGIKNILTFYFQTDELFSFNTVYEVILCHNPTVKLLAAINYFLRPGTGLAYLVYHDNQIHDKAELKELEPLFDIIQTQRLESEEYQLSPLLNQVEGEEQFGKLSRQFFYVVTIKKKVTATDNQQPEGKKEALIPKQVETTKESINAVPLVIPTKKVEQKVAQIPITNPITNKQQGIKVESQTNKVSPPTNEVAQTFIVPIQQQKPEVEIPNYQTHPKLQSFDLNAIKNPIESQIQEIKVATEQTKQQQVTKVSQQPLTTETNEVPSQQDPKTQKQESAQVTPEATQPVQQSKAYTIEEDKQKSQVVTVAVKQETQVIQSNQSNANIESNETTPTEQQVIPAKQQAKETQQKQKQQIHVSSVVQQVAVSQPKETVTKVSQNQQETHIQPVAHNQPVTEEKHQQKTETKEQEPKEQEPKESVEVSVESAVTEEPKVEAIVIEEPQIKTINNEETINQLQTIPATPQVEQSVPTATSESPIETERQQEAQIINEGSKQQPQNQQDKHTELLTQSKAVQEQEKEEEKQPQKQEHNQQLVHQKVQQTHLQDNKETDNHQVAEKETQQVSGANSQNNQQAKQTDQESKAVQQQQVTEQQPSNAVGAQQSEASQAKDE